MIAERAGRFTHIIASLDTHALVIRGTGWWMSQTNLTPGGTRRH